MERLIKPYYILGVIAIIYGILALITWLFPKDGIELSEKYTLKFVSFEELIDPTIVEYKDIDNIIEDKSLTDTSGHTEVDEDLVAQLDTNRANADSLRRALNLIQFPNNKKSLLYPFFEALASSGQKIRVLHYGDSQIEGDRITSFLRFKFQSMFSGGGPGMYSPVSVVPRTLSISQSTSDNWEKTDVHGKVDTTLGHYRYGAMLSFCRYAPIWKDTIWVDSVPQIKVNDSATYEAWIAFDKTGMAMGNAGSYSQFSLYYGYNLRPVEIALESDGEELATATLPPGPGLRVYSHSFGKNIDNLRVSFKGKDSPDIYAMTLDKPGLVAFDNIPLRGSSGVEFTQTSLGFHAQMLRTLNAKLIIMQFGVNVVPNVKEDYGFYERWFYAQLSALRRHNPGVPIIVIGVSDMSRKEGDFYESYPNIEMIRDAMRNAAFRSGCGFWDMYEAMGGKNSMPSWVFAEPPLAVTDFTHFTYRGSVIIANMFFNAIYHEYQAWKRGGGSNSDGGQ